MAIIPVGQKFHTLTSSTVTSDLGSARANSGREIYTMQDIINTVSATGGSIDGSGVQYALPVFTDTNTITNLPVGNAGQVLTSNGAGSNPSFQTLSSGPATQFDQTLTNITTTGAPNQASNIIGQNVVQPGANPIVGNNYPNETVVLGTNIGNDSSNTNGLSGKIGSDNVLIGNQILRDIPAGTGGGLGFVWGRATIIGTDILDRYASNTAVPLYNSVLMGYDIFSGGISSFTNNGVENSVIIGGEINTQVSGAANGSNRNVIIGNNIQSMGSGAGGFNDQVVIGSRACSNNGASQITVIGADAARTIPVGGNSTVIGYNAQPSTPGVQNEITLGNASVTTLRCATATITTISDERDKTNIENLTHGLDLINSLQPRKFVWDVRDETIIQENKETNPETGEITVTEEEVVVHNAKNGTKDIGFIAQELQTVDDDFLKLVHDANPDKLEASYSRLIPVLVKSVQELSAKVTALENA